ncbi:uncharacterized protein PAC_18114 [Phialocephala subalpina]|uniref:Uncharacterized protein n=1 Tax=Phialocephala subalpina TaxID=576137 RepID=A0A1L7XT90_9HELO|nr:uncharacterized protein PAC_18114 [Phialocephala subalpina]
MSFIYCIEDVDDPRWGEVARYIDRFKPLLCDQECAACLNSEKHQILTLCQNINHYYKAQTTLEMLEAQRQQVKSAEQEGIDAFRREFNHATDVRRLERVRLNSATDQVHADIDEWLPLYMNGGSGAQNRPEVMEGFNRWLAFNKKRPEWLSQIEAADQDFAYQFGLRVSAHMDSFEAQYIELERDIENARQLSTKSEQLIVEDIKWFRKQQELIPDHIPARLHLSNTGNIFLHKRN